MEAKECMFCLCDVPKTKQIESPCDCRPHLHQRCLNKWYKTEPNTCPICRLNYEAFAFAKGVDGSLLQVATLRNLSNEKKLWIILTFVGVVYLIFLLFVID